MHVFLCVCVFVYVCDCVVNMLIFAVHKDNGTFGSSVKDEAISCGFAGSEGGGGGGVGLYIHTYPPAVCIRTDISNIMYTQHIPKKINTSAYSSAIKRH